MITIGPSDMTPGFVYAHSQFITWTPILVINQTIQQTATIAFYQVEPTTTGQISYGVYPTDGFADATALGNAVLALGNVQITNSSGQTRGVNVSGSQSTDVGFKLALS